MWPFSRFFRPKGRESAHGITVTASKSQEATRVVPTVRFDPVNVTEKVKRDLQNNVRNVEEFNGPISEAIYRAALVSIERGRDMAYLFNAIVSMNITGMTKEKAEKITINLHNKATVLINQERQQAIGIEYAVWLYSGAPCYRNPKNPSSADLRRDEAHKAADGKKFKLREGMLINGRRVLPGRQEGCRCASRAVIPGLE